jgi:NAD(P)-dependent dehydrogenase (short-subunit alcohol dehydrogenase family)
MQRIALVTGASRRIGIGAAVCRALAGQGVDVAFTHWRAYDREMPWGEDADAVAALEAEIRAQGARCLSLEAESKPGLAGFRFWSITPPFRGMGISKHWMLPRWTRIMPLTYAAHSC